MKPTPPRIAEPSPDEPLEIGRGGFTQRVLVEGSDLSHVEAENVVVRESTFLKATLVGGRWTGAQLTDVRFSDCDLSGVDLTGASLIRVEFLRCRLTGIQVGEAEMKDVRIADCKLDYGNFRAVKATALATVSSDLKESDFQGANLKGASFEACQMEGVDFAHARLHDVDLRGARLDALKSTNGLSGAIVTTDQLIDLAPLFARDAGMRVV